MRNHRVVRHHGALEYNLLAETESDHKKAGAAKRRSAMDRAYEALRPDGLRVVYAYTVTIAKLR